MSAHTKGRHTNKDRFIEVIIDIPGKGESIYKIPNTQSSKEQLKKFFQNFVVEEKHSDEKAVLWRDLAKDRIVKYTEQGIALRGARYREGLSQKELAKLCDISQDNLSRMENGKRVIGEKLAKKLGKILNVDYHLFMTRPTIKKQNKMV